jgi:NAD(P)-dependent dehydrogenase (short-subunit alcohol dehydrogenase family)
MIMNDATYRLFRPDLQAPTRADAEEAFAAMNLLPVPFVESHDVSEAVLWLASDQSRFVTGVSLPVDAGALIK